MNGEKKIEGDEKKKNKEGYGSTAACKETTNIDLSHANKKKNSERETTFSLTASLRSTLSSPLHVQEISHL